MEDRKLAVVQALGLFGAIMLAISIIKGSIGLFILCLFFLVSAVVFWSVFTDRNLGKSYEEETYPVGQDRSIKVCQFCSSEMTGNKCSSCGASVVK